MTFTVHKGQNIHLTYSHSDVKFQLVKGSRTEVDLDDDDNNDNDNDYDYGDHKSGLTEVGDDDGDLKWTWMNCM